MRQLTISNKKASKKQLAAAIVAVLLLVCVRMDSVVMLAQALVPTSTMVGQEVFIVLAIVGLWYLVWGGVVLSLVVRVAIRLIAIYMTKQ
mgnify:CR=1 FL=1